jgi:hypothetical protein
LASANGRKARTNGSPLSVVSLYTGAGGLDLGLEAAGFETAVAIEFDRDACATIRANRDWPLIERDIHAVTSEEILDTAGLGGGTPICSLVVHRASRSASPHIGSTGTQGASMTLALTPSPHTSASFEIHSREPSFWRM